jgi:hypothetical protein
LDGAGAAAAGLRRKTDGDGLEGWGARDGEVVTEGRVDGIGDRRTSPRASGAPELGAFDRVAASFPRRGDAA